MFKINIGLLRSDVRIKLTMIILSTFLFVAMPNSALAHGINAVYFIGKAVILQVVLFLLVLRLKVFYGTWSWSLSTMILAIASTHFLSWGIGRYLNISPYSIIWSIVYYIVPLLVFISILIIAMIKTRRK